MPIKVKKYTKITIALLSFFSFCLYGMFYTNPVDVNAQADNSVLSQINTLQGQMADLNNKIKAEEQQVNDNTGKIKYNANQISVLQNIISQKQELITDKQNQINLLNQSIDQEKKDIDALNANINQLYSLFVQRAKVSYEYSYVNPLLLTIGNKSIVSVFADLEYFSNTRKEDSQLLSEMRNNDFLLQQKLNDLNIQQTDLTNAQTELVSEKNSLQSQQSQLQVQLNYYASQNNQIQHALTADQQKYAQLVSQINALQIAAFGGNAGCVPGNYWYFNQQCYNRLSGMYGTSIDMTYGCLITDIAMVATKELGASYSPPYIASKTWFSGNYMMAWPDIPLSPNYLGYHNLSAINAKIAAGVPVIVYLSAPSGEHWIVLYGRTGNGDYIINDPWYGSGLTFSGSNGHEYYATYQIGDAYTLE